MQGIKLLFVGRTDSREIKILIQEYQKRLARFIPLEIEELPDIKASKHISQEEQKKLEGDVILSAIGPQDEVILLDEHGKQPTSKELAHILDQKMLTVPKRLIFIIGGPYGFSSEIMEKYPQKLSLSKLTFSHQMVRLFLIEQIYRGFTILHNHPYHHE